MTQPSVPRRAVKLPTHLRVTRDTSFSSSSPTSYRRRLAILKLADRRKAFKRNFRVWIRTRNSRTSFLVLPAAA
eukprot:COSAG01_NODE_3994_length_5454_cov_344.181699_6_plen_74_part_00